jgi:hypothetical protein
MNTAHRYWLFEGSTLFLTASTLEWARIKKAEFKEVALKIVDSEACERMENCWKLPEVV